MSTHRRAWRILESGLWLGAGAALWLYVCNRVVLQWSSPWLKNSVMVLLAVSLYLAVRWARAHRLRALWSALPLLILGLTVTDELRRLSSDHPFVGRAQAMPSSPAPDWWNLDTTTQLVVRRSELTVPQRVGTLRVVHLTDLHISPQLPWDYFASIVARTNAEAPDLIVLTGDFLSKAEYLPLLRQWLALGLHARLGSYAVLGNHEIWAGVADEVRSSLAEAGIQVLSGSCTRLVGAGAEHVVLCGDEAPWGDDFTAPVKAQGDVVIALTHTPDNIYDLQPRADLVFAGHYHGGQWRVPGWGALIIPSVFGRRFDVGDFAVGNTELFVSAGLGADSPPVRVNCPPELLTVDLVSSATAVAEGPAPRRGDRLN